MKKLLLLLPVLGMSLFSCNVCYECTSEDVLGVAIVRETCEEDEMLEYEDEGWDCDVQP